jgi:hypothetical protein
MGTQIDLAITNRTQTDLKLLKMVQVEMMTPKNWDLMYTEINT